MPLPLSWLWCAVGGDLSCGGHLRCCVQRRPMSSFLVIGARLFSQRLWSWPALAALSLNPIWPLGLCGIWPGRKPCSARRCWRQRHLRVSFPSWRCRHGLFSAPLREYRGNPRSGSLDRTAAASWRCILHEGAVLLLVVCLVLALETSDALLVQAAPLGMGFRALCTASTALSSWLLLPVWPSPAPHLPIL